MRRLLLLCLGSALGLPVAAAADPPGTLRVLCYNIHHGKGTDDKIDVPRIAEVIQRHQPDLVALQEVDVGVKRSARVHQLRRLGELTGMASRFGPTQDHMGGLCGNGVLSRLPILDVVIHPLPYTPPRREQVTYPRGAIAITVKLPDGRSLRFISTHFQHNLAEDRLAQAQRINQLFAAEGDETLAILAGDLNALPDSEPMEEIHKRWTNAMNSPPVASAPSPDPHSRIDYILYRPEKSMKLRTSSVLDEPTASDHLPVFAVFELPPEAAAGAP